MSMVKMGGRGASACAYRPPLRLDFNNIPPLPHFVKGTRKQTCLAKTASKAAVKQLPQESQYQVSLHVVFGFSIH